MRRKSSHDVSYSRMLAAIFHTKTYVFHPLTRLHRIDSRVKKHRARRLTVPGDCSARCDAVSADAAPPAFAPVMAQYADEVAPQGKERNSVCYSFV